MKPFAWLAAGLVWILAGLLGVVGALLCVTIILLPLGIPLLMLARKMFGVSIRLVVPRAAQHPIQESGKSARRGAKKMAKGAKDGTQDMGRKASKASKALKKDKAGPFKLGRRKKRKGLLRRLGIG